MKYNPEFKGEYSSNKSQNLVPRAVIVIGKTPVYALDYNLVTNTNFESDSLNFSVPMDLIDIRDLIKSFLKQGSVVPIAVYAGFIDSYFEHFYTYDFDYKSSSNDMVKNKFLSKFKEVLSLRWIGLMTQPELNFEEVGSPDTIKFIAGDYSKILSKYKYENQYEGENASVEKIVGELNSKLSKFQIKFDNKLTSGELNVIKSYNMGAKSTFKDDNDEEVEITQYSTVGKTYFDILKDICEKTRTTIVPDFESYEKNNTEVINYIITKRVTSDIGWKLYRDRDFKRLSIRLGDFASTPIPQVSVKMISRQDDSTEDLVGTFPKNISESSPEGQRVFIHNAPKNLSKRQLEIMAEERASEISKLEINADLFIPNAIVGLKVKHQIKLENAKNFSAQRDLKIIGDVNFVVDSISEDYNQDGLSQKVEVSLDLNTNDFLTDSGSITAMNVFDVNDTSKDVKFLPPNNLKKSSSNIPEYLKKFRNNGFI